MPIGFTNEEHSRFETTGGIEAAIKAIKDESRKEPNRVFVVSVDTKEHIIKAIMVANARELVSALGDFWGQDIAFFRDGEMVGCTMDDEFHIGNLFDQGWGLWSPLPQEFNA